MLEVLRETPDQDDARSLILQSAALMQSLYAVERHLEADMRSLAAPNVHFFVARADGRALGCGALILRDGYAEPKRIFVTPAARGKGVARLILQRIEREAVAVGITLMRLEVGVRQPEAIALYRKFGYAERGPFGAYQPDPLSLFMEKRLA